MCSDPNQCSICTVQGEECVDWIQWCHKCFEVIAKNKMVIEVNYVLRMVEQLPRPLQPDGSHHSHTIRVIWLTGMFIETFRALCLHFVKSAWTRKTISSTSSRTRTIRAHSTSKVSDLTTIFAKTTFGIYAATMSYFAVVITSKQALYCMVRARLGNATHSRDFITNWKHSIGISIINV